MAKSKYAPALFEVISTKDEKPSGGLTLPKWWRSKAAPASPATPAQPTEAQQPLPKPADPPVTDQAASVSTVTVPSDASPSPASDPPRSEPAPTRVPITAPTFDIDEAPAPVARVREGRIELSLNTTNMSIVAGVLLIGLFLAYQVGRGLSKPATTPTETVKKTDDLDGVRSSTATPAALNVPAAPDRRNQRPGTGSNAKPAADTAKPKTSPPTPPAPAAVANRSVQVAPPPATPAASQRTAGLTYVILETFNRGHKPEADQIRQWLKEKHGIDTTIESSGEKLQLVSTQGFDYNNDAEKAKFEEFRQIVKGLGKQYKAEFGSKANYTMREPYGRKINQR